MDKPRQLWWLTRPTRNLRDLPATIRAFNTLVVGKRWNGNRELQKEFEASIPPKTSNVSRDGSGARTWAAWLSMWGLWHEHRGVARLTGAGEVLVSGGHNREQIRRLIMNFQLPSAYGPHKKLDPGFRIFPFRFVLRLLLDERLGHCLNEDEIAFFVIVAKTDEDYEDVIGRIARYRRREAENGLTLRERSRFVVRHRNSYRSGGRTDTSRDISGYLKYIKDIANTVVNNITYLGELEHIRGEGKICIRPYRQPDIRKLIDEHDRKFQFSTLYKTDPAGFVERFGLRYDRMKASDKRTPPKTRQEKNMDRIREAVGAYRKDNPNPDRAAMIEYVCGEAGRLTDEVEEAISRYPELDPDAPVEAGYSQDPFAEWYLECGLSGLYAAEFEEMTRKIMTDVGFVTRKQRIRERSGLPGRPEVDGLMLNRPTRKSSILECKSGASYTLTIGDREKMTDVYVKNLRSHTSNGIEYRLDMVVYVVGSGVVSGRSNFEHIKRKCRIGVSVISAQDLLDAYRWYRENKLSSEDIWNAFKKANVAQILRRIR